MLFDFSNKVLGDLPSPAQPYGGFPEFHFVGGNNDPASLDVDALIRASQAVLTREGSTLATYCLESGPQGYLPLRDFLVRKLEKYSAIECTTDDILLTSGSLQAIDLINEVMLASGDTVIIEQSNYGGVLTRLKKLGINMAVVPVDQDGMQTDALAELLEDQKGRGITPKYIYTIPTVHNPTGTIMSEQRRRHLIELAIQYDIPIFEDECYADLLWDGQRPPSVYSLDNTNRVIHVGSFSKTVAPALRVGYIVADWSLLGHLLQAKADAGSGALEQMVLAEYCDEHFDRHLITLNSNLKQKLDTLVDALNQEFGSVAEFCIPPGGIFLWMRLPAPVDTLKLSQLALVDGVAINPGVDWSMDADANRYLRICFANPTHEKIIEGVKKLAEVCFKEFGVPEYGANRSRL